MTVVVDISHLAYRNIFAQQDMVIEDPRVIAHFLLTSLHLIVNQFQVNSNNLLFAAFDCKRKMNWRHDFYEEASKAFPEYEEKHYKDRPVRGGIPWDDVWAVVKDVKEYLHAHTDIQVIEHEKAEADDVIYTISKMMPELVIISSDKDFKQLLSNRVKMYDPLKKEFITSTMEEAQEYLIEHILQGDKSDNILPIRRGIGPKTAAKMAIDLEVYVFVDKDLTKRYNFNKTLIDLKEVPEWVDDDIRETIGTNQGAWNLNETVKFYNKYKLRKLAERIGTLKWN